MAACERKARNLVSSMADEDDAEVRKLIRQKIDDLKTEKFKHAERAERLQEKLKAYEALDRKAEELKEKTRKAREGGVDPAKLNWPERRAFLDWLGARVVGNGETVTLKLDSGLGTAELEDNSLCVQGGLSHKTISWNCQRSIRSVLSRRRLSSRLDWASFAVRPQTLVIRKTLSRRPPSASSLAHPLLGTTVMVIPAVIHEGDPLIDGSLDEPQALDFGELLAVRAGVAAETQETDQLSGLAQRAQGDAPGLVRWATNWASAVAASAVAASPVAVVLRNARRLGLGLVMSVSPEKCRRDPVLRGDSEVTQGEIRRNRH